VAEPESPWAASLVERLVEPDARQRPPDAGHGCRRPPDRAHTLYAGTLYGVFRSTDAGASWSPVNLGLTNLRVRQLAIDPGGATTVHAALSSGSAWQVSPPVPMELLGFRVE
jgi:hypothetical protein